ncbi:glycosaminoglycan xylosylkinase-like [Oculina patagonica]
MVELWPFSVFYRAYFGTMKFKERFAFCLCVVLLIVPFIWLRMRVSDKKHPLLHSVNSESQFTVDEMDFNRIDHSHQHVQRSSEETDRVKTNFDFTDTERKVEKRFVDINTNKVNKEIREEDHKKKAANNDVDYEYDDPWSVWKDMVKSRQITAPHDPDAMNMILEAMMYKPIVAAGVGRHGTQLKATLTLEGKQTVVFKPMRYPRDFIVEGTPYAGFDRHNGEIAAFHLDRILGFYRAPPVVGRNVNLEDEIEPIAEKRLLDTFFKKDGNTCFYGRCYYCKKKDAACANGTTMEGSVTLWLPQGWPLTKWASPWQRTYSDTRKALWEIDDDYCNKKVLNKSPFDSGPRLLDLLDTALFDFLIGNADRHHYETFKDEGDTGMPLHLDNAKSFGDPHHDEMSILAPIYQCCKLRRSTWNRFLAISRKKTPLSELLRKATEEDPVAPILSDPHFKAIDRRMKIAIDTVKMCIENHGEDRVLVSEEVV